MMYNFMAPEDGWVALPSMIDSRAFHSCGLATKTDGTVQIVVAGKYEDDESEALELGGAAWR